MSTSTIISPVDQLRHFFPWLQPLQEGGILTFECGSIQEAEKIYKKSLQLIMQHKLPLLISLSVHWLNSYCFDINVIVKEVPEEDRFDLAIERLNQIVDHFQNAAKQ